MYHTLSAKLSHAWKLTTANLTILIGLQLSFYAFFFLLSLLTTATASLPAISFVFTLVSWVLQLIFILGMIRICLKIIDGEEVQFGDIFPKVQHCIRYISATLFITIIAFMIFFAIFSLFTMANSNFMQSKTNQYILSFFVAIPIVIVFLRFQFYSHIIVDRDRSTFSSLIRSYLITKDRLGMLVGLLLLLIGINILGTLALLVGLLFTVPVSMFVTAMVYRELYKGVEYFLDGDESDRPTEI